MNKTNKHAYLILAHNEFNMLKLLIKSLDDERNDIYVMVDAKSKNFNQREFDGITKNSNLTFVKRIKIYWASFMHVEAYYTLMKSAIKNLNYGYYHIISGVDIPLKTLDEIYDFFETNKGKQFLAVERDVSWNDCNNIYNFTEGGSSVIKGIINKIFRHQGAQYEQLAMFRYFFHKYHRIGLKNSNIFNKVIYVIARISLIIQKLLKITYNRNKDMRIYHGSDWFSITSDVVSFILEKEDWVRTHFFHAFSSSEIFVQTIVMDSKFKSNIYKFNDKTNLSVIDSNVRYIDWVRGKPYTFKIEDYDDLTNSGYLFARKFSTSIDREIVKKLYYRLLPAEIVDEILK